MEIREKFEKAIEEFKMIDKGSLACVSGGADSVCMLYLLNDYSKKHNKDLICLHLNHSIRGKEADRDMNFVKDLCHKLNIKFIPKTVDVIGLAKKEKKSIELVARQERYKFFNTIANEYAYSIMLAHNRDDRLETVIHNILRGSSLEGLKGISQVRGNIYRPLLDLDREDIEAYLRDNDISYIEDGTNKETIYTRNRIRLSLIPFLEENFNLNLKNSILRLSDLAKEDNQYLNTLANKEMEKHLISKEPLVISIEDYDKMAYSIRTRVLFKALTYLGEGKIFKGGQGIDYSLIKRLDNLFIFSQSGKEVDVGESYMARKEYNKVYFYKKEDLESNNILKYEVEQIPIEDFDKDLILSLEYGIFDYDRLKRDFNLSSLVVRNRQEGDYIIPFGFEGKKKIKNLFIDSKIPASKRDSISLLAIANEVLWIKGIRRSKHAPIDKETKNVIIFKLTNENMED